MADIQTQISELATLSIAQLRAISQDFRHPEEIQEAARDLINKISADQLRAAARVP